MLPNKLGIAKMLRKRKLGELRSIEKAASRGKNMSGKQQATLIMRQGVFKHFLVVAVEAPWQ